jgi:hypothetical protein
MKERLKANPDIFERLKIIGVANMLTLSPIDPTIMEVEANMYLLNSSTEQLKKVLPGAYVKTIAEGKRK